MSEPGQPFARTGWVRPLTVWLRWGALVIAGLLILLGRRPGDPGVLAVAGAVLVAFALWRSVDGMPNVDDRLVAVAEAVLSLLAVLATGGWSSPLAVVLAVPVLVLGLTAGWLPALAGTVVATAAMTLLELVDPSPLVLTDATQTVLIIAVGGAIGEFARRVVAQAEEEHEQTLGRIQQLGHVNAMLSTLHDLVRTMPAPLSVEEIVRVIRAQLDQLFDADAVVLLMSDGAQSRWRTVYSEGLRLPGEIAARDLPAALRERGPTQRPLVIDDFPTGTGLWDQARAGAYLWLWSRGQATGLLALEDRQPAPHRGEEMRDVLERLGVPLSLAIDNAVWFQRLRTLGAEEERQRIGAALHDRFAQSLAYVAMELDRTVRTHPDDDELERLRQDVRSTLADLRETLRELRLNVTEEHDLTTVLTGHLERFGDRFGIFTTFERTGDHIRPPVQVEQQLLRIVQDLLQLAQREMGATKVTVVYETAPGRVVMQVRDDGRGILEADLNHEAAAAMTIVRERADAIGAMIDVVSEAGSGSTVTVNLRGLL